MTSQPTSTPPPTSTSRTATPAGSNGTTPAPSANSSGGAAGGSSGDVVAAGEADRLPESPGPRIFSDAMGGFWAAATTGFCVVVGGAAHLVLLAADLGRKTNGTIHWQPVLRNCVVVPFVAMFVLGAFLTLAVTRFRRPAPDHGRGWPIGQAAMVGAASGVLITVATGSLCVTAWLSNAGRQVAWEPIVGASMTMVAFAAFGGYFLASRRARVGLAASFVLTFILLFSFMLTLQALNVTASGAATPGTPGASSALGDFIKDFRGDVALIVAFYFGTDAAVSAVKIWRTPSGVGAGEIARMDRDLAVPRPSRG